MPTRLSRYCAGVMEAAWLAAVILIPIFFNVYSSRIFEPDKLTLLRSLALIVLAAWVTKLIEEWRSRAPAEEINLLAWLKEPLVAPVLGLALIYIIANLFSVSPRVSFWGSYQRLQGTYTTFSYIILFASMLANLRKRAQVERLVTAVILSSIPVSLYGILQRYKIDPVPWGGDVSTRIAANLGNSIFVAAYLIMVIPLTIGRIIQAFTAILRDERLPAQVARATVYIFALAMQIIAMLMSGSRGPLLGFGVGMFFLLLLLSLQWRKRWMTYGGLAITLVGVVVLYVMQIPTGPLAKICESPGIGRFCHILDSDSTSAQVRQYIWEGAVKLVAPHPPLVYPDGTTDIYNFLRPVIGYGPESMYVAFNKFYVPELGQVEKRNASPDRSHNETWDSIVITGGIGLIAYLALFASVFYYALKWIGLITGVNQRNLFFGLCIGGGILGGLGLSFWRGMEYLGVGIPFGIAISVLSYLALVAMFPRNDLSAATGDPNRYLLLTVLLSALVSHFIEINFGIAIAVTRTYFWTFAALIVLVGYLLPKYGEFASSTTKETIGAAGTGEGELESSADLQVNKLIKRQKRGRVLDRRPKDTGRSLFGKQQGWLREALISGGITGLVLAPLGYDYISNNGRITDALKIIWNSFTTLPNQNSATSYGVLALIMTTWLAVSLVVVSESGAAENTEEWFKSFGATLGFAGLIALLLWLWHAGSLAAIANFKITDVNGVQSQVEQIGGLLTQFYIYIILIIFALAVFLPEQWPSLSGRSAVRPGWVLGPVVLIIAFFLINATNLRVIHADITYKMAEPFTRGSDQWPIATLLYKSALKLAPDEDYYYLFLGRSYLEQAKAETDTSQQDNLVKSAEEDLQVAQKINPLNTDHTANLARLYSWWATRNGNDAATRLQRGQIASNYYKIATTLSPQNSTLWGEWALLFEDVLQNPAEAKIRLDYALGLDTQYSWTQGLMGDYYLRLSRTITPTSEITPTLEQAAAHYSAAVSSARYLDTTATAKIGYIASLAGIYARLGQYDQAITAYQQAIAINPKSADAWKIEYTIAQIYTRKGDKPNALLHATQSLNSAPDAQKANVQKYISQIQAMP